MKNAEGFDEKGFFIDRGVGGFGHRRASASFLDRLAGFDFQADGSRGPSSKDVFDAHVNGVARFLTAAMEEATVPTLEFFRETKPSTYAGRLVFPIAKILLIHFPILGTLLPFVWPKGPAQRVHAYLYFEEGEGLSIAWFSELQELEKNEEGEMAPEDEDELFKTMVSPFARKYTTVITGTKTTENSTSRNGNIRPI